jgi:hypothetical protein
VTGAFLLKQHDRLKIQARIYDLHDFLGRVRQVVTRPVDRRRLMGDPLNLKDNEDFGELLDALEDILTDETKNKTFKICRVKLEDDPTGCYGKGGNGQCKGEVNCEKDW